ncbi:MAG TPA: hypothetical protein IGS17_02050 [Oscillatoriales cyanobacterium M59_W2019_021]|nr:MAG: hypothetical protein D6728_15925 [Cyanobacteria bacterium J055]HIK32048.1 hypothetical protein [Oscillatoriales cyanobacterium M4454_W2019_049]HIK49698.1 hypothetical protein [Oscillatoriales cyanobacterium M59_W2019_021]
MTDFPEFLTSEEAKKVDAALLVSKDKFMARLAIYALRSLQQISRETGKPIESISPEEVALWIQQDDRLEPQIDLDANFTQFFSNLVVSAQKPLAQTAAETQTPMADLTVEQVITWFENKAKS